MQTTATRLADSVIADRHRAAADARRMKASRSNRHENASREPWSALTDRIARLKRAAVGRAARSVAS